MSRNQRREMVERVDGEIWEIQLGLDGEE